MNERDRPTSKRLFVSVEIDQQLTIFADGDEQPIGLLIGVRCQWLVDGDRGFSNWWPIEQACVCRGCFGLDCGMAADGQAYIRVAYGAFEYFRCLTNTFETRLLARFDFVRSMKVHQR